MSGNMGKLGKLLQRRNGNRILPGLSLGAALLSGCSSISPDPGSDQLMVRTAEEVIHCQFLGWASGHTQDKISVFPRNADSVAAEVLTLARNEALRMEVDVPPNAMVIETNVAAGSRTFGVYHCPDE